MRNKSRCFQIFYDFFRGFSIKNRKKRRKNITIAVQGVYSVKKVPADTLGGDMEKKAAYSMHNMPVKIPCRALVAAVRFSDNPAGNAKEQA